MKATLTTLVCGLLATCALTVPAMAAPDHSISWSGQVDDTVIVRIHGNQVQTRTIHGNQASNVSSDANHPLPVNHPVHVWLSDVRGRGTVKVVREPSATNNYTAVVKVYDPQSGSSFYHFVLHWHGHRRM